MVYLFIKSIKLEIQYVFHIIYHYLTFAVSFGIYISLSRS